MSAYLIVHTTVKNPEKFQEYAQLVGPTLTRYEGQVILKGKMASVVSGDHDHATVGILQFPSIDQLNNWYHSEDYQALIPIRNEAAEMTIISYESV